MLVHTKVYWTSVCLIVALASPAVAAVEFERDILPVLQEHCIACHGPESQESKLRLDTMLFALRGGNSGEPIIVPGDSLSSHLIERVTSENRRQRMPPDSEPLNAELVDQLRVWIDADALWTEARSELAKQSVTHWSFQPLMRPSVPPATADVSTARHPIDRFIEKRLHEADLRFAEPANKRRLIRRLYLVMHGLPPTPAQVDEFLSDDRQDAWAKLVEEVLESPRYGERLATYWLDLVRFGETNGFETNRERPNAYPYRDWVINSFNADKPYDQFVRQQIAGDALGEPIGTGFLVAGPNDIVKGQDALLGLIQRQDELADIVSATGTTFLGLTTGCARCHNHKFDPITQSDYYALQAVFAGVEHADQDVPLTPENRSRAEAIELQIQELRRNLAKYAKSKGTREPVNAIENVERIAPTEAKFIRFTIDDTSGSEPCIDELQIFVGDSNVALASAGAKATSSGDFEHPLHKLEHLNDGQFGNSRSWIAKAASGGWAQVELAKPERIDRIVWGRDRNGQFADRIATVYRIEASLDGISWKTVASSVDRLPLKKDKNPVTHYDLEGLPADEARCARQRLTDLQTLELQREKLLSTSKVYAGKFFQPAATKRLYRGDPTAPREVVEPGAIRSLTSLKLQTAAPEQQRRLALANWIASRDNPLTARVMVNRIWQFQFGTGLVDTPSDFGANGTLPTHPELLDWLASEFIESVWSIKELHRLILTSNTWQQDSRPRESAMAVDASSRLLWRYPIRRLEAEGIRDCILAVTGKLDLQFGGPGFSAFEVELENVRHYFPKKDYGSADWRRMVYMTKVRMEKDSIFGVFDCPDGSQVTPKRNRSTTPLQALNLLNSQFVLQQAEFFAERVRLERDSLDAQIGLAYELCFGRTVDQRELADAKSFIADNDWGQFARALLNANEFVFIP